VTHQEQGSQCVSCTVCEPRRSAQGRAAARGLAHRDRAPPAGKELELIGNLDHQDVPPRLACCYMTLAAAVLYAIQAGAPTEAYEALMVIATVLAVQRGQLAGPR
jgi:hypothetical protein